VHGLGELTLPGEAPGALKVVSVTPARMIEMMARGEIDVGMAPVAGVFEHPEWRIVGRSMIGSRGPVRSVVAISMDPPERWTLVHPDSHSRTSNALIQILLARRYGVRPPLGEPIPPGDWRPPERPAPGEAFLLIGTRALRWRDLWRAEGGHALDLGEAWTAWTGLPFVYAVWAARPGVAADRWMEAFENLKARNLGRLEEITRSWPGLSDERLSPSEAREYLLTNIALDLDGAAIEGLLRFYREGVQLGLFVPGWKAGEGWHEKLALQWETV
jgi:chorismate dehydratase